MGRTGITPFWDLSHGEGFPLPGDPPRCIGIGIFQAASLHAAAALTSHAVPRVPALDLRPQLAICENRHALRGWAYSPPEGPGLGVEPNEEVWQFVRGKEVS